jgi:hypothetical protein
MRIIAAAALCCLGLSACTPHPNPQTSQTVLCPAYPYIWTISNVIRETQYQQCW